MTLEFFQLLIKRLNIKNYDDAWFALYSGNSQFFDKYYLANKQIGGNEKTYKIPYIFDAKTYNFEICEIEEKDRTTFKIIDKEINLDCVTIFYYAPDKMCYIETISYYNKCVSGMPLTKGGVLLLKFTLHFIKNILTKKYNIKFIQLLDKSGKLCGFKRISLLLMSTLLFGHTWYGKYGFRPKEQYKYKIDKFLNEKYGSNIKIIDNAKLKDVPNLKKYFIDACKKYNNEDFDENGFLKYIDLHQYASIKYFLRGLLMQYDKTCKLFYYIYKNIFNDLNLYDFSGKSFILIL